jgi:hypothetical protein
MIEQFCSGQREQVVIAMTIKPTNSDGRIQPSVSVIDRSKRSNQIAVLKEMFGIDAVIITHTQHIR